jgi:hypothetical protein
MANLLRTDGGLNVVTYFDTSGRNGHHQAPPRDDYTTLHAVCQHLALPKIDRWPAKQKGWITKSLFETSSPDANGWSDGFEFCIAHKGTSRDGRIIDDIGAIDVKDFLRRRPNVTITHERFPVGSSEHPVTRRPGLTRTGDEIYATVWFCRRLVLGRLAEALVSSGVLRSASMDLKDFRFRGDRLVSGTLKGWSVVPESALPNCVLVSVSKLHPPPEAAA